MLTPWYKRRSLRERYFNLAFFHRVFDAVNWHFWSCCAVGIALLWFFALALTAPIMRVVPDGAYVRMGMLDAGIMARMDDARPSELRALPAGAFTAEGMHADYLLEIANAARDAARVRDLLLQPGGLHVQVLTLQDIGAIVQMMGDCGELRCQEVARRADHLTRARAESARTAEWLRTVQHRAELLAQPGVLDHPEGRAAAQGLVFDVVQHPALLARPTSGSGYQDVDDYRLAARSVLDAHEQLFFNYHDRYGRVAWLQRLLGRSP